MTLEELKQELVNTQTIQILLDNKLHRYLETLTRLQIKIEKLEKEVIIKS